MAKSKQQQEPTRETVMEISRRLSAAYEAEDLAGMEPHELTEAVRELMILSRRAGVELTDDYHPVQTFLDTVASYDEDEAQDLFENIREMELRDRAQLAAAEAQAGRERFRDAAEEILERSGSNSDELRSGIVTALMRATPAPHNAEDAIEEVREIARAAGATARTINAADLRTDILSALPPSQTPFGAIHSSQRRQAIQDHAVATGNWESDLEEAPPVLTHEETLAAQEVAKGEILAASQGPVALRSYREEHGLDTSEYA